MKKRSFLVSLVVLSLLGLVAVVELKRQAISAQLSDITEHLQEMKFDDPTKNQETADLIVKEKPILCESRKWGPSYCHSNARHLIQLEDKEDY